MKRCNHFFVGGFGCMGDAMTCKLCLYSKYPEAMPLRLGIAAIQGRIVRELDPGYDEAVMQVQDLERKRREQN